jgi:hypothetical protein
MIKLVGILTAVTALIVLGAVFLIQPKIFATAEIVPPPAVTISIQDLHRQVDMRTLPVTDVKEPF